MLNAVDAIILCGGAGLRLRSVTGSAPKSLASIGSRPFLDILLSQLRRHAFQCVILAAGYQSNLIRSQFGTEAHGLAIRYSIESAPLGTGGAVRNALNLTEADALLILNGDSYTDADLPAFVADYLDARADISVLVVPDDGRTDCGLVSVNADGRVAGFREKQSAQGRQYVNAGVYVITKKLVAEIPSALSVSLETELFPRWLAEGKHIRAFCHPGRCVDIGTPERYRSAQVELAKAEVVGC